MQKTDTAGYVKDEESSAIINIDENDFARYLAERQKIKDVEKLKCDVEELKARLSQLESIINEKLQ